MRQILKENTRFRIWTSKEKRNEFRGNFLLLFFLMKFDFTMKNVTLWWENNENIELSPPIILRRVTTWNYPSRENVERGFLFSRFFQLLHSSKIDTSRYCITGCFGGARLRGTMRQRRRTSSKWDFALLRFAFFNGTAAASSSKKSIRTEDSNTVAT